LSDPEFVQWLIEHGADPNASCYFDITPLSAAAQSASKEVIELLFKLGASVDRGQPLHFAVMNGRPDDIVTLFLEKGAAINARMYESHERSFVLLKGLGLATPLHEAAKAKNIRLVQLLQENGADPKIPDTLGRLPQFEI
jgi:ankyrin repeat protein